MIGSVRKPGPAVSTMDSAGEEEMAWILNLGLSSKWTQHGQFEYA